MILYLCIKFQSNTPIFSKDIARKPFVLRTGRTGRMDGTDVRTDSGDTICPTTENGGNIKNVYFTTCCQVYSKTVGWVANSVDPDQTPRSAASDLDLHCLLRPVCLNNSAEYGMWQFYEMYSFIWKCTQFMWKCTQFIQFIITKTRIFKHTENFTTKKWKFSDKNSDFFLLFLLKT